MPYRIDPDGTISVLLITTRETRRWMVPKGNPIGGLASHEAAAREAYEEAGVRGIASPAPLGSFTYIKRKRDGSRRRSFVQLYPLAVTEQVAEWPERDERDTAWFALDQASAAVAEPDLQRLIGSFRVGRPAGRAPAAWPMLVPIATQLLVALASWLIAAG